MSNDSLDTPAVDTTQKGGSSPRSVRASLDARLRQLTVWSGVGGMFVGLGTVATATVISETFSWTHSAISDLGAASASVPWLFNGGLIVSGLIALPFVSHLWRDADNPLQRFGALSFGVTLLALTAIGLFPIERAVHAPVSYAFYTVGTVALISYGVGSALSPRGKRARAGIPLGLTHALSWLLWWAGFAVGPGLAVPELVGAVLFSVWVIERTLVLRTDRVRSNDRLS